jgi:RES domain-containing protein
MAHRRLDGEGARLFGGRWNQPGSAIVYTSSSLALAALEYLVHVDPADAPRDLVALTLAIPDDASVTDVAIDQLPVHWARTTESAACRAIGDAWIAAGTSLLLRVPAAPVPEERNVLINVRHPEARRVRVSAERPFRFDPRLVRK